MKTRCIQLAVLAAAALALLAAAAPAHAAADLEITAMSLQGTPRVGSCNTVSMTVKNNGDAFTGNATLDVRVITFPSASPLQNRAQKDLFISPMQPGAQVTFNVSNVEFLAAGAATLQAVVDSTNETAESNEDNNTETLTTTVSGTCAQPPSTPLPTANAGCDLSLTFIAPTGTTAAAGTPTFTLRAKNEGSGNCTSTPKLRLYRYNGSTASGYGSAVGGTRTIWAIPALGPGEHADYDFTDKVPKGTYTYAPKFLSAWNDANNNNHRTAKTVTLQ
jgi:hypothetical protein